MAGRTWQRLSPVTCSPFAAVDLIERLYQSGQGVKHSLIQTAGHFRWVQKAASGAINGRR